MSLTVTVLTRDWPGKEVLNIGLGLVNKKLWKELRSKQPDFVKMEVGMKIWVENVALRVAYHS